MRAKTVGRYAVFLILLVLGQEFCVARYVSPGSQSLIMKSQGIEKREAKEDGKTNQAKSRQKRLYAVVLLGVTLASASMTVGFEIYLKIKGCCGIYKDACHYADEIVRLRKSWDKKTKEIDVLFLKVKNLREDIIQHSYKIQGMFVDLEAITRNYASLVNNLSPGTPNKFLQKWKEIENELKKGNRTIAQWTYQQVNLQFLSYFDDPRSAIAGLTTFLTNAISAVYQVAQTFYMRSYQNKMISKLGTGESYRMLVTAKNTKAAQSLGLNDISISKFVKDTAKGKVNGKFGVNSKYSSLYHAYNVIGTLMSLGSDAYRIYRNVEQCKNKRDQLEKIYDFWYEADQDMNNAKTNATNYLNELTNQAWKYVKGNLSDPNLLKTLENVNKIFQAVSPTTPRIVRATKHIRDYVANINTTLNTNPDNAYTLEVNLIYGLMTAKLLTECFNKPVEFVAFISNECKQGFKTLANSYNDEKSKFVVKGGNCLDVGVKEITLGDMQKAIAARATKEKYNVDCILNNKDKQNLACNLKLDGYKEIDIASKVGVTISQVRYFLSKCPPPQLAGHDKTMLCILRGMKWSDEMIRGFLVNYPLASIAAAKCP